MKILIAIAILAILCPLSSALTTRCYVNPGSATINAGQSITLYASATASEGTINSSYWYEWLTWVNSQPAQIGTGQSITVTPPQSGSYSYFCVAKTNSDGNWQSGNFSQITVMSLTSISTSTTSSTSTSTLRTTLTSSISSSSSSISTTIISTSTTTSQSTTSTTTIPQTTTSARTTISSTSTIIVNPTTSTSTKQTSISTTEPSTSVASTVTVPATTTIKSTSASNGNILQELWHTIESFFKGLFGK